MLTTVPYVRLSTNRFYNIILADGEHDSNLTVIILICLISATFLLIVGLLIMLRCVIRKLRKKPQVVPPQTRNNRRVQQRNRQPQIIRTELDPEIPYAINAPPSYQDTMLADMRVQSSTADIPAVEEETSLLAQDVLANTTQATSSETPQPV